MPKSIPISHKHGLNPSLEICFWCGQDTGAILLYGRLSNDSKAPYHSFSSYQLCPKCEAIFSAGILVVEVTESPNFTGQKPLQKNSRDFPTGRLVVVSRESIPRMFRPRHRRANPFRRQNLAQIERLLCLPSQRGPKLMYYVATPSGEILLACIFGDPEDAAIYAETHLPDTTLWEIFFMEDSQNAPF